MWRRNLIFTLAVIAAVFLFSCIRGDNMKLEFGEEAMAVTAPDSTVTTVPYADILGVTLFTDPDYGVCVSGKQAASCWYGTWRNAQWQRYRLCVHPKVNNCLAVETADGVLALNGASVQDTTAIKASLEEILRSLS